MKLKYAFIIKVVVWLILTAVGVIFTTMTNLGLQITVSIATKLVPGKLKIRTMEGTWWSAASIQDITYQYQKKKLDIQKIEINLRGKAITANKITGIEYFLPHIVESTTSIEQLTVMAAKQNAKQAWLININAHGLWNSQAANANATMVTDSIINSYNLSNLIIDSIVVNIANNLLTVKRQPSTEYKFNAQIKNFKVIYKELAGDLQANGWIKNINNRSILELKLTSNKLLYDDFQLHTTKLDFTSPLVDHLHPLNGKATVKTVKFFDDKITNFSLDINGNILAHSIKSHCNFLENEISYHVKGKFKDKIWEANGNDPDNHIHFKFNFNNPDHLDGSIKLSMQDFSQIGELLPKISRVKAKLKADATFKGTYEKPKIRAHAEITEITATIPSMGVKIKPMSIILDIDEKHKLTLDVFGKMRKGAGEFTLTGYMHLDDRNYKNSFALKGTAVEFIKTKKKHLIANADLHFQYDHAETDLNVDGNIEIIGGFLHLDNHKTIVKSQDIVFTDNRVNKTTKNINIIPRLYLRIEEPLIVTGFNLDSEITGKLLVTYENKNLYGSGRITIKKGTYSLPGKKLTIDRGRLIYPEGTLLSNPMLDIKMIKLKSIDKNVIDAGIFVSGTARNPVISDIGITGGNDQTLSQALMAGSSIIPNEFAEILNISDIGIIDNNTQTSNFFDENITDLSKQDKSFFIGRQFGDRTYLQYQRSLQDEADTFNFKYALTDNWSIGFDAGTQSKGTDLSFSIEKD